MTNDVAKFALIVSQKVAEQAEGLWRPSSEAQPSKHEGVLPASVFKGSKAYIEKIVFQINGSYASSCFDACAVMLRRLLETLIIEAFERHEVSDQIKDSNGSFVKLGEMIDKTLVCSTWNLSRNTKRDIKKLKDIGDLSAHNRYYMANRTDIDNARESFRVVTQELLLIADSAPSHHSNNKG